MKKLVSFAFMIAAIAASCPAARAEVIVNGDFSAGNSGFASGYNFIASGTSTTPGTYAIRTNPQDFNPTLSSFGDHTTGSGNMMLIDGSEASTLEVWSETVSVTPNTDYLFSAWGASTSPLVPSILRFTVDGSPLGPDFALPTATGLWQNFTATWTSGSSATVTLTIFDVNTITNQPGNDFALDDLSFAVPEPMTIGLLLSGIVPIIGTCLVRKADKKWCVHAA